MAIELLQLVKFFALDFLGRLHWLPEPPKCSPTRGNEILLKSYWLKNEEADQITLSQNRVFITPLVVLHLGNVLN